MNVDQITLVPIESERTPAHIAEFAVLDVNRSNQSVVLRVSGHATGAVELGSRIRLTTDENETYEGYVEVVAEATDSWICWCGVCFQPVGVRA